jgi:hypothetical protein
MLLKNGISIYGKEGCARETQEGCPAPFESKVFRTPTRSENLPNGSKFFDLLDRKEEYLWSII